MTGIRRQSGLQALRWHWNYKVVAFAVCFLPLTVALGFWQLHRAAEKREILAADDAKANTDPVPFRAALANVDKRFLRVWATGEVDNGRTFLADNRVRHGRPGYEVVSPFRDAESGRWLLVNRGWIAGGLDRNVVPAVPPLAGVVTLTGYLYQSPSKAFVLGEDRWQAGQWPQIVQVVEPELLQERLGESLFPYVLRLENSASPGLETGWELVNLAPGMHIGYAVQWFAMAVALLILTIFANSNLASLLRRPEQPHE